MYSSELRNRLHPGAQNANLLNKWASNKSAIQSLPANLKVSNRDVAPSTKNLQINFLKCNGTIATVSNAVSNTQFTLDVSTLTYFVNYTDFNKLNPDASVAVHPQVFSDWHAKYLSAKNPVQVQGSTIAAYEPSAIVSYFDETGKKVNYICKITNIIKKQDGNPSFLLDTLKVRFYDSSSVNISGTNVVRVPVPNNPEVSKIDTNFSTGTFNDIRIDFDPLYDPLYHDYKPGFSFFLQSDMQILKNNGNCVAALPMTGSFVSYSVWSPTDVNKNQEIAVYVDNISYFTRMFRRVLFNRTDIPKDLFKPSTTLEYLTRDGKTSTNISQITDCYVYKDNLIFELNNEIVKMYDLPINSTNPLPSLVSSYETISKIMNEGKYTQVRMDIDESARTWFNSITECIEHLDC